MFERLFRLIVHSVFCCTMTTPIPIFIVLSLLPISTLSVSNSGIKSAYCKKSQIHPYWYVPTPIECCGDQAKCDKYILPHETKYGLTNPDKKWPRRHCSCERKLYECVTKDLDVNSIQWARYYGFSDEKCFRERHGLRLIDETNHIEEYEFVYVLDTVSSYFKKAKEMSNEIIL